MNLRKMILAAGFVFALAIAVPLRAQTGCVDSPEDPTVLLALVGGVGVVGARLWSMRHKSDGSK